MGVEFIFILIISAYMVKGIGQAVPDSIALAKGKPPPSLERWKATHPDKPVSPGVRGYFGRMVSNAVEAWADRSSQKHRRRKLLLATRQETADSEWLRKKLARTDKRAEIAARLAARFGVVWDRAKNGRRNQREDLAWQYNDLFDQDDLAATTAEAAKAAQAEAEAANAAAAAQPATTDPTESGPGDTPSPAPPSTPPPPPPPPRPSPGGRSAPPPAAPPPSVDETPSGSGPATGADIPFGSDYPGNPGDTGVSGFGSGPRATRPSSETPSESTVNSGELIKVTAERLDTAEPPPAGPLLLEAAPLQLEMGPSGSAADSAGTPAVNPTRSTTEVASMTASAEIITLPAGKAYTAKMSHWLSKVQGVTEAQQSELTQLVTDIKAELQDAELVVASLTNAGFTGASITELQLANEQLTLMQGALEAAERALAELPDSATAASGAYDKANAAFARQEPLAEQAQIQAAEGNVAKDTSFYTNA